MNYHSKAIVSFAGVLALALVFAAETPITLPYSNSIVKELLSLSPNPEKVLAAGGQTYYIAPNGNDSNPGTSAAPFATIQKGVNVALAGDTIIVKDGTYGPASSCVGGNGYAGMITSAGTAAAPITLMAEHQYAAVLDSQSRCYAYFYFNSGAAWWVISGFDITKGYESGIAANSGSAHDIVIRGNHIHNNGNRVDTTPYGITGIYTNETTNNFTIEGNIFNDIGRTNDIGNSNDHSVYTHGTNFTIINNVFYRALTGWHIQTAAGFSGLIANNTFYGPNMYAGYVKSGQIELWGADGTVTIRNNIFYGSHNTAVDSYGFSSPGCNIDNNIIYGSGVTVGNPAPCTSANNRLNTDPLFVNASVNNFYLQSGSPAIDTGVSVPSVTRDFNGNIRPQGSNYDVGAYEYTQIPVASAPVITGATAAGAQSGTAFSYQISASNGPTGYSATGLPAGLSLNPSTGLISGSPVAAGIFSIALTASNGSGTGSAMLSLTVGAVTVTGPVVSLSPSAINFGSIPVGTVSPPLYLTINNIGNAPYIISNVVLAAGSFAYAGTGTCNVGTAVAAGQNCTVSLKFSPTAAGSSLGSVTFTDNAPGSPRTVSISGTGTAIASLPVLSNLVGSNTTAAGNNISWTTNVPTNGRVFYGFSLAYGLTSALLDNTSKTQTHTVALTNLTPSTLYHFKVTSIDGAGMSITSPDYTFTTLAAGGITVYIPPVPGLPVAGGPPETFGNPLLYLIIILIILGVTGLVLFLCRKKQPANPK